MQVVVDCNRCQKSYQIKVKMEDMMAWQNGKFIQDAMPYLTTGERELLISNTCDTCWEELFPPEEEEEVNVVMRDLEGHGNLEGR